MNLNKALRRRIIAKALELSAVTAKRKTLDEDWRQLAKCIVRRYMPIPSAIIDMLADKAPGSRDATLAWLKHVSIVEIRSPYSSSVATIHEYSGRSVPHGDSFFWRVDLIDAMPVCDFNVRIDVDVHHPYFPELKGLHDRLVEVNHEEHLLIQKLREAVESCRTVARLVEAWPEALKFLPEPDITPAPAAPVQPRIFGELNSEIFGTPKRG